MLHIALRGFVSTFWITSVFFCMSFLLWNPKPEDQPAVHVPVTVLCGFLGAGKTTVLNNILATSASHRFAVVVNDLGEVNIDASLIKSAIRKMDGPIEGILELQGGCICCSIQSDLLDALLELYQQFQPDHILIEATGVAEPHGILETLYSGNFYGKRGTDFIKVANMVTVVDGGNLEQYLDSSENTGGSRRIHLLPSDPRRPVQELLMEQIERADILLINKVDVLETSDRRRFHAYIRSLNRSAEIWESSFGQINVEKLMSEHRFDEETTLLGAAWQTILSNESGKKHEWKVVEGKENEPSILHSENHHHVEHDHSGQDGARIDNEASHHNLHDREHEGHECDHHHDHHSHHHHKDYGLETYVFNARKPFLESRFLKLMRTGLNGVIRAKGFYWTERVPEGVGLLSIAGKIMRADYISDWWHTRVQRGELKMDEVPENVRSSWLPEYGDRRQELVFIGIDLDREAIEHALKGCFVDEEFISTKS